MYTHNGNLEENLSSLHAVFTKFRSEVQDTLRQMDFDRESVSTELTRYKRCYRAKIVPPFFFFTIYFVVFVNLLQIARRE